MKEQSKITTTKSSQTISNQLSSVTIFCKHLFEKCTNVTKLIRTECGNWLYIVMFEQIPLDLHPVAFQHSLHLVDERCLLVLAKTEKTDFITIKVTTILLLLLFYI